MKQPVRSVMFMAPGEEWEARRLVVLATTTPAPRSIPIVRSLPKNIRNSSVRIRRSINIRSAPTRHTISLTTLTTSTTVTTC